MIHSASRPSVATGLDSLAAEARGGGEVGRRRCTVRVTVCSRPRLVEHCFGVLRQAALEVERIEFFIDEARRGRQRITVVARPCGSRQVVDFIRAVGGSDPVIDWGRA